MKKEPRGVGVEGLPTTARKRRRGWPLWKTTTCSVARRTRIRHSVEELWVRFAEIHPLCPFGRPGRRTRSQAPPSRLRRRPRTGRTVRLRVRGRLAATVSTRPAWRFGARRATWSRRSATVLCCRWPCGAAADPEETTMQPRLAAIRAEAKPRRPRREPGVKATRLILLPFTGPIRWGAADVPGECSARCAIAVGLNGGGGQPPPRAWTNVASRDAAKSGQSSPATTIASPPAAFAS